MELKLGYIDIRKNGGAERPMLVHESMGPSHTEVNNYIDTV